MRTYRDEIPAVVSQSPWKIRPETPGDFVHVFDRPETHSRGEGLAADVSLERALDCTEAGLDVGKRHVTGCIDSTVAKAPFRRQIALILSSGSRNLVWG